MTNYLLIPIFIFILLQRPVLGSWDLLSELSGRDELVQWAGYGEDKLSTVVITGTILCNAADLPSINTHPVSGARVSVVCGSGTKKKWSTAKGSTDVSGKFAIDLPSHLHAIPNLERVCHVRVVHLPLTSPCRKAKHNKAIALSSVDQGIRTYTTHNIHLNRI